MVVAKLSRPCSSPEYNSLVLYCVPSAISDVISNLPETDLVKIEVEFIKVVE